ncbi:NAD-dependent epimerase/dehydratase family protein [Nonomuraea sp. KM88]|uniref:NAD-dependent epimerase/dehydratase family protein n=1 Tax=Nonomuraea sp. KM88 TaxID=3457427 RepID=UPI003FCD8947
MHRVLITGASGFIGAHVTRRLRGLSVEVHAVSRGPRASLHGEIWHQCDLREEEATAALMRAIRPQVVFHLAGEVSGRREVAMVSETLGGNLLTAVNLLAAATRTPARLVFAGSVEEPHAGSVAPHSPYSAAKAAATGYAMLFHHLWNIPVTVLRIAMVYGPGQEDLSKLVPYVATELLQGRSPQVGSGTRLVDWVFVDDVVDALVAAALSGAADGQALDVGSGTGTSIRATVDLLHRLAGTSVAPVYGAIADRARDRAHLADVRPAEEVLGWRAATPLAEGLARTLRWYAGRLVPQAALHAPAFHRPQPAFHGPLDEPEQQPR